MMKILLASVLSSLIFSVKIENFVSTEMGKSSSESKSIERFENIPKGGHDGRSYRGLKLANDLRILLVSNPNSISSGAAMTINVGSLNDFDELPGMAHFTGEMFNHSGNFIYPEREFTDILNALLPDDALHNEVFPRTEEDKQFFFFQVGTNHLSLALETFAQYFHEPQFMTSNSRSLLEVAIERTNGLRVSARFYNSHRWQIQQIEKSISEKNHPFHRSPYGNTETFTRYLIEENISSHSGPSQQTGSERSKTILHDKLRKFYSMWYSSNLMCLVVFGRESLDQLEGLTVPLFKNIQNRHVERLSFSYEQHPWGQEQLRRKIFATIIPNLVDRQETIIRLVFRVPDVRKQYKTAPEVYVSNFIKRREPGSLLSLFNQKKLCELLKTHYYVKAGIAFFEIACEIFDEKIIDEDEVVELIFQYIRLLKTDGIHEWLFTEDKNHNKMLFSTIDFSDTFQNLASLMHEYPMNDILSYKYLQDKWDSSIIENFLTYLTPGKMNVFILTRKPLDVTLRQDDWHQVPYRVEMISDQLIEKWKTVELSPHLSVPHPNEFVIENLDIIPLEQDEPEKPYVIHESPRSRIWFLQDNQNPNVQIKFDLLNPRAHLDPSSSTLLCITSELLNYIMTKYKYYFLISGYNWFIKSYENFINSTLQGYSDKILIFVEKVMSEINVADLSKDNLQDQFDKAKLKCIIKENDLRPRILVMRRLKHVLSEAKETWSLNEIEAASQSLQFEDLKKFLSKFFSHLFIQGLIVGNCTKQKAIDIAKIIETPFESAVDMIPQEMMYLLPRMVEIEGGKHFLDVIFSDAHKKVHSHQTYYQFGVGTKQNAILSSLLITMIANKCHDMEDVLMVHYGLVKLFGVIGLLFWTSHTNLLPEDLDLQFENCLRSVHVMLLEMTDIEFEEFVRRVIEKETTISPFSPMSRYWDDIESGFFEIQQDKNERIEDARFFSKTDVLRFFENALNEHSPNCRKYSILLFPKVSDEWTTSDMILSSTTKIDDVITFKNDSNLLPLPTSMRAKLISFNLKK